MNYDIKFPALVIGKSSINKINYPYLLGDKRMINQGYKNVLIVDTEGNCFDIEKVEQSGGINWLYSIKLIGLMVRLNPILKRAVFAISLDELKHKLIEIVNQNSKRFESLFPREMLVNEIRRCKSYNEIINIF